MSQLDHYISQLTLNIKAPTLNTGDELMHVRAGVWALLTFPTMTKTSHRIRLTDEHLRSIMKVASAQNLSPNINELVCKKRCQVSGLGTSD